MVNAAALYTYAQKALNVVLPSRCIITGEELNDNMRISSKAWAALDFINDPMCICCGMPFSFDVEEQTLCTACLDRPPLFASARAALIYNDNSRDLVLGFKHADKTHAVKAFTPWLLRTGSEMLKAADLIIPVPLHYTRLIKRRYNQAALIGKEIGRESGIDFLPDGLRRIRATPTQGHLSYTERSKNVKRAFAVHPKHTDKIKDKTIILVDDVYTTGATIGECTQTLLKSGAKAVHVLTLTRVVQSSS